MTIRGPSKSSIPGISMRRGENVMGLFKADREPFRILKNERETSLPLIDGNGFDGYC